jgi:hypothetical protein
MKTTMWLLRKQGGGNQILMLTRTKATTLVAPREDLNEDQVRRMALREHIVLYFFCHLGMQTGVLTVFCGLVGTCKWGVCLL